MAHKGLCIGGICGVGIGISMFTEIITIPLHSASNPYLQLAGVLISIGSGVVVIIGMKK